MLFPEGCCGRGNIGRSNEAEPERNVRCSRPSPIKELIRKAKRRAVLEWIWGVGAFSDTVSLRGFPSATPIGAELGLGRGDGSLVWVFKEERWGFPRSVPALPQLGPSPGAESRRYSRGPWLKKSRIPEKAPSFSQLLLRALCHALKQNNN